MQEFWRATCGRVTGPASISLFTELPFLRKNCSSLMLLFWAQDLPFTL